MPNWTFNDMEVNIHNDSDKTEAKEQFREFLDKSLVHPKITDKDGNITGEDKTCLVFTFKGAVPMPDSLNIVCGTTTDRAIACILYERGIYSHSRLETIDKMLEWTWVSEKVKSKKVSTRRKDAYKLLVKDILPKEREDGEKAISNLEKYGCKDWYDWCIRNWGTKWDAGNQEMNLAQGEDKKKFIDDIVEDEEFLIYFETAWSPPMNWMQRATEKFPLIYFVNKVAEESNAFVGCPIAYGGAVCENITSVDHP